MMGIDIANTVLANNAGLIAVAGGNQIMKLGPAGILQRYNTAQPLFRASGSGTPVGVNIGAANDFTSIKLNKAALNVGACYNTANGLFTAPVNGVYLFTASTYCTGTGVNWYIHALFYVNSTPTTRRPSGPLYRIRGHGYTAGYIEDTESFEMMQLFAGDYVEFVHYSGSYVNTYVPQYSRFEGYLLN